MSTSDRRNSAGQAATGAALFGIGAGGSELLNRRLKGAGAVGPVKAAYRTARARPAGFKAALHVPHIAGKLGVRGLQAVGLPLAAYGVVNAVRPTPKATKKLRLREDVVRPVVHHAVLADQVQAGKQAVGKALTRREQTALDLHRRVGRTTSLVGGSLGLGALAARTPGGAKLLGRAGVRSGKLVRLAAKEPHATKISNTLGVGAIGTGAAGSFNYAAQQKLERKAALTKAALPAKPARLPAPPPTKAERKAKEGDREFYRHHGTNRFTTKWMGQDEFADEAGTAETEMKALSSAEGKPAEHAHWRRQLRAASEYHRTREEHDLADEIDAHLAASTQRHQAARAGRQVDRDVRKDAFLRGYRQRISPDAERGYKSLKQGRNRQLVQATGGAGMAALGGWLTHHELRQPHVAKPAAIAAAAGALASAVGASGQIRGAHRYSAKMGKIKAKARSRRALGLYGPGRGMSPVDESSARAKNLAKAMSGGAR